MDDATLTVVIPRNSRNGDRSGLSGPVWIAILLLVLPVVLVGFFRLREASGARGLPTPPRASVPAPTPTHSAEIHVIAPPMKEAEPVHAKKKRRPKDDPGRRALERLQRAQLDRAER